MPRAPLGPAIPARASAGSDDAADPSSYPVPSRPAPTMASANMTSKRTPPTRHRQHPASRPPSGARRSLRGGGRRPDAPGDRRAIGAAERAGSAAGVDGLWASPGATEQVPVPTKEHNGWAVWSREPHPRRRVSARVVRVGRPRHDRRPDGCVVVMVPPDVGAPWPWPPAGWKVVVRCRSSAWPPTMPPPSACTNGSGWRRAAPCASSPSGGAGPEPDRVPPDCRRPRRRSLGGGCRRRVPAQRSGRSSCRAIMWGDG